MLSILSRDVMFIVNHISRSCFCESQKSENCVLHKSSSTQVRYTGWNHRNSLLRYIFVIHFVWNHMNHCDLPAAILQFCGKAFNGFCPSKKCLGDITRVGRYELFGCKFSVCHIIRYSVQSFLGSRHPASISQCPNYITNFKVHSREVEDKR